MTTTNEPASPTEPLPRPPRAASNAVSVGYALQAIKEAGRARPLNIETGDAAANAVMRVIVTRHGFLPPHVRTDYLAGTLSRVFTFASLAHDTGLGQLEVAKAIVHLHQHEFIRCEFTACGEGAHVWITTPLVQAGAA